MLLIEPDPERARALVHSLTPLHVVVTPVADIGQASRLLSHIQPDAILVSTPPGAGSDLEAWLADVCATCPGMMLAIMEHGRLTLAQGCQPARSAQEPPLRALQLGQG